MLCANKVDLRSTLTSEGRRCVSADEGDRMAREHSAIFLETSAKDGSNIIEALVQLSRLDSFQIVFEITIYEGLKLM